MKQFCFLISLQAGCTVISIVFVTLASVVFLVNLPHLLANTFLIVLLSWLFLILCVALTSFMAAYLESSGVTVITLYILAVTTFYWFCISIIPFASSNDKWLRNLCVNERCGESLWLTALSYHKLHHNYCPQNSKFMRGDGIFNATSIFSNYNGKNGSNGINIERKGNEAKGFNRNSSSVEYHNLSQDVNHSFQKFSNLLKTNFPDLGNSHETKQKYYRNPMNDTIQIQINSKKSGLRSMTERNDDSASVLKLKNLNDSWLQINTSGNIFGNEFTDLVNNNLQLSGNDDTLLNKNDVVLYYEHAEPVKKSNQFWGKSSIGLRIVSFFLLLMNLIFYIYCWFAIYSYWNLLRRSLHDVYQSSDFNESDSYSQSTTKSSWQDH